MSKLSFTQDNRNYHQHLPSVAGNKKEFLQSVSVRFPNVTEVHGCFSLLEQLKQARVVGEVQSGAQNSRLTSISSVDEKNVSLIC